MAKDMQIEEMPIDNVGIMQGFLDMMNEEDDIGEGDDYESAEELGRSPDSPEILMNNLRGDMRSIDARREELADLVGYTAAAETPEPVLAMLQPVLAQQGIGALPMPGAMPPGPPPGMPPGMPPPGMMPPEMGMPPGPPPGMPPGPPPGMMPPGPPPPEGGIAGLPVGQPPLQMAQGGLVQYFRDGSDEDGVTPKEDSSSISVLSRLPPALRDEAQRAFIASLRTPTPVSDIKKLSGDLAKQYAEILGTDRKSAQAQMLLELGQRAFGYAANVDEQGRPLRGSQFARLAGAVRTLPTTVGKYAADIEKEDRAIKLAGVQAAEKQIQAEKEQLAKQQKNLADLFKEDLKALGKPTKGPFGSGVEGSAYNIAVELATRYGLGETTPEEDRKFSSAYRILNTPYPQTNEKGELIYTKPPKLDFLEKAFADRAALDKGGPRPTGTGTGAAAPAGGAAGAPATGGMPSVGMPTLLSMAGRATGPINVTQAFLGRYTPGFFGELSAGPIQADAFVSNAINRINRSIATNPRFAEGERQSIKKELDLLPSLLRDEAAFSNRLVGIDLLLERLERDALAGSEDKSIKVDERLAAANDLRLIRNTRDLMGVKDLPLIDPNDPERSRAVFSALAPDALYKRIDPQTGRVVLRRKARD